MRKFFSSLFRRSPQNASGITIEAESGSMTVAVQDYKIVAGNSPRDKIEAGLASVVNKMVAICHADLQSHGQTPTGSITYTFRLESDGMIRMILEGEKDIVGGDFAKINDQFIGASMSRQVVFPPMGQPTMVEVRLKVEKN